VSQTIAHGHGPGPVKPVPRVAVGWRVVDRGHAEPLIRRGFLDSRGLDGLDPHCSRCGHRARVHSLDKLPLDERWRWHTPPKAGEDPRPCQWRGCECPRWSPHEGVVSDLDARACGVFVRDTWIEVPLGSEWVVAYRIVRGDRGRPVVGEIRMFPAEPARPEAGRWSGEILGSRALVPAKGITGRQVKRLRVRAYLQVMAELVQALRNKDPEEARFLGWGLEPTPAPATSPGPDGPRRRRGPKGRPDVFYAAVARDYVRAIQRGSPSPVRAVAQARHPLSASKIRDMIRTARARDLLTRVDSTKGIAGGGLTPKAEALLASTKTARSRKRSRPRTTQQRRRPRR
jgi:hypothetical protein